MVNRPASQISPVPIAAERTLRRWWMLTTSPYSILRTQEYEILKTLSLDGKVLDIGGGKATEYGRRLPSSVHSVNMDPLAQPRVVADLNGPLPFATGAFDSIISLNTYEHLLNEELAVREALRVLRGGGSFHIFIPFVYAVHGSPFDWHRHTADWWRVKLTQAGADSESFRVMPMGWCRLSSALSLLDLGKMRPIRGALMFVSLAHTWLSRLAGRRIRFAGYLDCTAVPLGYYVSGHKTTETAAGVTV
jgi:SAM-dependent methyltransferase